MTMWLVAGIMLMVLVLAVAAALIIWSPRDDHS
jgi:hypothetical protein